MLRKIGRVILFLTGAGMIAIGVVFGLKQVDLITQAGGFAHLFDSPTLGGAIILNLVWQLIVVFCGIAAFFCGVSGYAGIWIIPFFAVMLGIFIWNLITKINAGTFSTYFKENMLEIILDVVTLFMFIVSFIMLRYGIHKDKKDYKKAKKAGLI